MKFQEKKVSIKSAIAILAKNTSDVNTEEAVIILDLLYLIAKTYKKTKHGKSPLP
jgi:hypothetical protein